MLKAKVYYAGFIPVENGYAVFFPDFLGCTSFGENLEDAFAMASEALEGHIEAMTDDNDEIPIPSTRENAIIKLQEYYKELDLAELPEGTFFLPVKAPLLDTKIKQIAVSLSKYKLDMIDKKATRAGMTRSGFLVAAANAYDVERHV